MPDAFSIGVREGTGQGAGVLSFIKFPFKPVRYQNFPLFVCHVIPLLSECKKELLHASRPLRGLQDSLILVFRLQVSPKLFTTLEVGLEPARDDGAMVVGFALQMVENCSHTISKTVAQ